MNKLTPEQRDRIWKTFTTATEEARDVQWDWFENVLNANTTEDEPIAGVTFGDGEFVPIEDESIMQWIAEQLQQEDSE